jgi:hypothetical protein
VLRRFFDRTGTTALSRPCAPSRDRGFRPRLESLEDRQLLSGVTGGATVPAPALVAPAAQSSPAAGAQGAPASTWQGWHDELGRLWEVISLTKNADQAPWLSLQFGKGGDADALKGQPASSAINRMGVSWGTDLAARTLIITARILFDEARHASGDQQGQLVKRGNALLDAAGGLIRLAEGLWADMWSELWRRPWQGTQDPPASKPIPWDVWIGLTPPAQAQEPAGVQATKVEDITWKPGSKWYVYESLAEYKRLTGRNYTPPKGAGAVTFRAGTDIVTIFASRANMQNKGLYAHERTHMIIFTADQYRNLLGNDINSIARREQLAYYAGWQAAKAAGDAKTAATQKDLYDQTVQFLSGDRSRVYNFVDGNEIVFIGDQPVLVPKK